MIKVLFVCVENACRSQMAEAWFNHLADPERMMGSRGMGFIKGMLLGSTSDKVVREAKIPVFVCN